MLQLILKYLSIIYVEIKINIIFAAIDRDVLIIHIRIYSVLLLFWEHKTTNFNQPQAISRMFTFCVGFTYLVEWCLVVPLFQ